MILGTYAAAAGTTVINIVGLHQTLVIAPTGGALDATITNVQVKVAGEGVLIDINANQALLTINDWRKMQSPSVLTNKVYVIPMADGFIAGKNVQIIITKSGAGTAGTIYGFSQAKGTAYCQIINQTILANSGLDLSKFLFAVTEFGATDRYNLTFKDGFNHQADAPELISDGAWTQVQNDQVLIMIDNATQRYKKVNIIPAANRSVYVARFVPDSPNQDLFNTLE
jgi:hypothetical protein